MDLQSILAQYAGMAAPKDNTADHFDTAAGQLPDHVVGQGVADAFRSDQTPAFGSLIGNLFRQSNGEQKAGLLNHLIGSLGPGALSQIAGGGALANVLGGAKTISPEQAQNVSPELVQQMATHAQKADPSIVDRASAFYAQHPTLVKTLGAAALSIVMSKMAQRQRAA